MSTLNHTTLFSQHTPQPRYYGDMQRGKFDFAIAYPDPRSIPTLDLSAALAEGLAQEGQDLALYTSVQGYLPLRQFISDKLAKDRGIQRTASEIQLTSGAGQALHITFEMLIEKGDVVLCDDFTYSGALWQMNRFSAAPHGVKTDQEGMLPDALEDTIQTLQAEGKRLKLIYLIPNFQNPQGWTISLERRKAILEIAYRHGLPILEDDSYADLRYNGNHLPPLHALDTEGHVIYVSSFSKTIAPGVRVGYLAADKPLLERAMTLKSGGPVPLFVALAVHRFCKEHLASHIEEINDIQMHKRDAMLAALGKHFGDQATWVAPEGGLSIWVKLREGVDVTPPRAAIMQQEGVGYVPGNNFAPDGTRGKNYFRLSHGYNQPEEMDEGIGRLANAFRREGILE